MIVLPGKMPLDQETRRPTAREAVRSQEPLPPPEVHAQPAVTGDEHPVPENVPRPVVRRESHARVLPDQEPSVKQREGGSMRTPAGGGQAYHAGKEHTDRESIPQHRRVVTHTGETEGQTRATATPHASRGVYGQNITSPVKGPTDNQAQEAARRRIELELQRQRMMALAGSRPNSGEVPPPPRQVTHQLIRQKQENKPDMPSHQREVVREPSLDVPQISEKRTIIVKKRSPARETQPDSPRETQPEERTRETTSLSPEDNSSPVFSPGPEPEDIHVSVKDPAFRAKDEIFSGRTVRGSSIPSSRDQSLLHTNLTKKTHAKPVISDTAPGGDNTGTESASSGKPEKKTRKHDDISWI
jgi:hypothetical protein